MIRILTSLVLVVILFAGLFIHSIFWLFFIVGFSAVASIEFAGLHFREEVPAMSALVIAAAVIFPLNIYLRQLGLFNLDDNLLIPIFFISSPIIFMLRDGKIEEFKLSVPMAIFGSVWFGYLMSFQIYIYFMKVNGYDYGIQLVLLFAYLVCGNDVGAYYLGKNFGKHKVSRYSPNKTWEGIVGGVVFALFTGALCHFTFAGEISLLNTLVLAMIVVITGSFGDLVESIFKRSCQVKDAGGILPGHGGIMDRIDSIVFATPAFYWYIKYMIVN